MQTIFKKEPAAPGLKPEFVLIPGGEFVMGCDQGRDEERPIHRVWVDRFEMCATQVRNLDYALFLRAASHPEPALWHNAGFDHPSQPVVAVSWFDAIAYCDWLSDMSGSRCRLPTEAEWEYAAKAGRDDALYSWGSSSPQDWPEYRDRWLGEVSAPLPVGAGTPNPFGLYDMGENVHEWCSDWYDPAYYAVSPSRNPQGPTAGERRASRGGSWRHQIKVSRCAARSSIPPHFRYADYGFRVVREIR